MFDLMMVAGSGTSTATLTHPEPVEVSDERPLCRTSQLMVCFALAMIRIVIYDLKIESKNSWKEEPISCKSEYIDQLQT